MNIHNKLVAFIYFVGWWFIVSVLKMILKNSLLTVLQPQIAIAVPTFAEGRRDLVKASVLGLRHVEVDEDSCSDRADCVDEEDILTYGSL